MEHPQFEVYPLMTEGPVTDEGGTNWEATPTGEFGWRYRAASDDPEDPGTVLAISARPFPDREAAEMDVERLMGSVLTVGAYPPGSFSDPQTGVAWQIVHVEEG